MLEYLEAERIKYAIRLPANQVLQNRIGYLLKRPIGRPPNEVRRCYANFTCRAASWSKPRRVIAEPGEDGDTTPGELAHARIEALCRRISPALAAAPIKARQTCFRPVTEDGLPLIGALPGIEGAYVATGHSVWGMLNAPATGEAISELILEGGPRQVDLGPFEPGRLRPLDPARQRGALEG
jgi:glycine/D-amino acid oxidase-like deaminating enzyme